MTMARFVGDRSRSEVTFEEVGEHRVMVRDGIGGGRRAKQVHAIAVAQSAEGLTTEAIEAMDGKRWAVARDKVAAALAVDAQFAPALLLTRALRWVSAGAGAGAGKAGDIGWEEALKRAQGVGAEKRERGKRFCEKLVSAGTDASPSPTSTPSSSPPPPSSPSSTPTKTKKTSGMRHFVAGYWADRMEGRWEEAARLYGAAAEQGVAVAQFQLGSCFENGEGVAKDAKEAARWYRAAAEQGLAPAQNNLGTCYLHGHGVGKDAGEAVRQYRLAAEQGHAPAMYNLGSMYENGLGVTKNVAEAIGYYRLASDSGVAPARIALDRLGQ